MMYALYHLILRTPRIFASIGNYRFMLLGTSNKLVRGCDAMQILHIITLFSTPFVHTYLIMQGFYVRFRVNTML